MFYLYIFIASLAFSAALTLLVKRFAIAHNILDVPDSAGGQGRKIHGRATPLLGGVAIFLSYFILLFVYAPHFLSGNLRWSHLISFFVGALIIIIGGSLDDKFNLRPSQQIIFPLLAIASLIIGGVAIEKISNPFGGYFYLDAWFFIGPLLIAVWLLGMMYTTKLLDGVDGLVSGVSAIGGLVIFLFTLTTKYYQPDIAFAAILLTGAIGGFFIFNWHPAKIFLGEGGSLLLGYILGVLAIISGGKIAIALLVMGIPILDVAWTILRRVLQGKNPFRFADKKHLHHRLLALGLGQKKTVIIFYSLSLVFGLSGLFLQSRGKLWALIILIALMFLIVIFFWFIDQRGKKIKTSEAVDAGKKPSLLLHVCCAPCAAYITQFRLRARFNITWFFYNSNLNTEAEYNLRLEAVRFVANKFNINLIVEPYNHNEWMSAVKGREADPERGERCKICYRSRLLKTVELAQQKKFDFFSTSLLVSPYKDTIAINKISRELAAEYKINFLAEDFQAEDAYRLSQNFAKELGIYRQKFCGCEYSINK